MEKKNRSTGFIGIKDKDSVFNKDFGNNGMPRQKSDGTIYVSDVSNKFPYRKYWHDKGLQVFYFGRYNNSKKMQYATIDETYQMLFGHEAKDDSPEEFIVNWLQCVDVMNFGGVSTIKNRNISLTGAIQFGQGINKYEESEPYTMQILSAFRNGDSKADSNSNEENKQTNSQQKDEKEKMQKSVGETVLIDEAHYLFPFNCNPNQTHELQKIVPNICYTQEAYEEFKEASLVAVSSLNTRSKMGCENELALFIELKEDSNLYLPNLEQYVTFEKNDNKGVYDFTQLAEILNSSSIENQIESVELYYNPYTLDIKGDILKTKKINIITRSEINEQY